MAAGWLYNPGNPHAADARRTGSGQVPKYYRLTAEPFSVIDAFEVEASFGASDVILKKIPDDGRFTGRITGIIGFPEWWMVPPDRHKLIDFTPSDADPLDNWEQLNPGFDWQDFYPRIQWWLYPGNIWGQDIEGERWAVIAHLWSEPYHLLSVTASAPGGGHPDFPWVTSLWSAFGRNELQYAYDPGEGPRVWVEAYWP